VGLRSGLAWWDAEAGALPLVEQTLGGLLDAAAVAFPRREAVVLSAYEDLGFNARWTYAELKDLADRMARALLALGIVRGERVAVWAPNVAAWLVAEFAVAKVGAVLVTLNPTYRADEVRFVLEHSESVACLFLPRIRHLTLWEHLRQVRGRLPALRALFSLADGVDDVAGLADLCACADRVDPADLARRQAEVAPGDVVQMQYTSGTTGRPKGAMLTHRGLVNNARQVAHRWGVTTADRWCNPMPLFHTAGCAMVALGCLATGATHCPIVWFDADRVLETIERERCTIVETVPTTLAALLQRQREAPRDLGSLRLAGTGGAPTPVALERQVREAWGATLGIVYGLTETSPIITQSSVREPEDKAGATVGRPLPWTEVRIVDPASDRPLRIGRPGEVQTRGYLVMAGYLKDPGATAAATDAEGWFRTGDLGVMDGDGYLNIVGRIKDMIIRGGENLYATEVENVLTEHPAVLEACVVGVPDARYGEEVCAVLRLRPQATVTEREIQDFVRQRASHQKVPRYVRVTETFPLTGSGKIQKFALREAMIDALGLRALASTPTA
jgi:fatty-acyl-CoA synthase